MDFKQIALDTFNSKKFEGFTIDCNAANSRLHLTLQVKGSVDLPGELDQVIANVVGMLGLGNSKKSIDSPAS